MARSSSERFTATAKLSPEQHERTLFDRVCDAIGASAAFVAHDVMPDIRAKLIDEAWFGRPPYPGHGHTSEAGASWRTASALTIEGEFSQANASHQTPDLDR